MKSEWLSKTLSLALHFGMLADVPLFPLTVLYAIIPASTYK